MSLFPVVLRKRCEEKLGFCGEVILALAYKSKIG